MTHIVIRTELAQAILNYLGTQPYANVWQMIQQLQQAQSVDEKPDLELVKDDAAT